MLVPVPADVNVPPLASLTQAVQPFLALVTIVTVGLLLVFETELAIEVKLAEVPDKEKEKVGLIVPLIET